MRRNIAVRRNQITRCLSIAMLFSIAAFSTSPLLAEGYRQPAQALIDLVSAPPPPAPLVHAQSKQVVLLHREQMMSQSRLETPRLGLAGLRLDPVTRITGVDPLIFKLELVNTETGKKAVLWETQGEERLNFVDFSPNGNLLSALQIEMGKASQLVVIDVASKELHTLTAQINPAFGSPCYWADEQSMICKFVPEKLELPPPVPGPKVQENHGEVLPTRTYSLLLDSDKSDAQFEQYFSSNLARVNVSGAIEQLAVTTGVISTLITAPGGDYASIRRIQRPYSRLVKAKQFPTVVEVWDLRKGIRLYQSMPMGFGLDDVSNEDSGDPDSIVWNPFTPVTVGYLYRDFSDDGKVEYQWRVLRAPFDGQPEILVRTDSRIRSFGWSSSNTPWYIKKVDGEDAVMVQRDNNWKQVWQGRLRDKFESPGRAMTVQGSRGPILEYDGRIYLSGSNITDDGVRPFLHSFNLDTGEQRKLFASSGNEFEQVLAVLDPAKDVFLTARETEVVPMQLIRREGSKRKMVYASEDPYPQLKKIVRRQIHYKRDDGLELTASLYLPSKKSKAKLPTLVWIYPREYDDPELAEHPDARPLQFHGVKGPSAISAVLAGYVVVMNPTVPIIQNDQFGLDGYLSQLVSSTSALVDYLVAEGITDPDRVAIGGRSYGAFSTANLLIHSDKFATGIAMSGAYNRTLTPFGFQHEKRTFWDATDYYADISPFFHADKLKKPILIVHGGEDPNPGTPKMQAERFFHALVGEGATVRYVELPGEEHVYRGSDTLPHATWEMINWLDNTIGKK